MTDKQRAAKHLKMEDLQVKFTAALTDRMHDITSCWTKVSIAYQWGEAHTELSFLAHGLAGTAGTFGYFRLGDTARQLDRALRQLKTETDVQASETFSKLPELIANLQVLLTMGPDQGVDAADLSDSSKLLATSANHQIALIEYDACLAQEMAMQLLLFGWETIVFSTISEALAAFPTIRPAAAIFDLATSDKLQEELEFLKNTHLQGGLVMPHLVLSRRTDWEARLAAVRSGAFAYLTKPLDMCALAEQLDRAVNGQNDNAARVLIVDDDVPLAEHYCQILTAAGMNALAVNHPAQLLAAMAAHHPEIVLMDLYMPGCNGIEALKIIRLDSQYERLPVLFLSSETNTLLHQYALQSGAEAFLQKPIAEPNLIKVVRSHADRFRALTRLIRHDNLTGLLNPIAFKLRLEIEVDCSLRSNSPLTLAMLDIDNVKSVNDVYGHLQGDRVISSLALLLRKRLRQSDIIGRYGGEEFMVAMPDTTLENALKILEELRVNFSQLTFDTTEDAFSASFSAGLAGSPSMLNSVLLIHDAESAMYQAKKLGRNRIEITGW